MINEILKLIDTANKIKTFLVEKFGVSPHFTIRGRPTFQTKIGTILTIKCIIIILNTFFFLNFKDNMYSNIYQPKKRHYFLKLNIPNIYIIKNKGCIDGQISNKF